MVDRQIVVTQNADCINKSDFIEKLLSTAAFLLVVLISSAHK